MDQRPRRTFTLLDAIVLVAATCIGCAWIRPLFEEYGLPEELTYEVWEMIDYLRVVQHLLNCVLRPLLVTGTLAILGLRFLRPRPPLSRLMCQPGVTACASVALVLAGESFRYFANAFAIAKGTPRHHPFFIQDGLGVDLHGFVITEAPFHYPIAMAWGMLLMGRRWRPEKSWIDRIGRAFGLLWMILPLWTTLYGMVNTWQIEVGPPDTNLFGS